jgi:hypothetical protein
MESVFIGGSIRIRTLPAEVNKRLDTIIEKGFKVLVGDAKGVDSAIQDYLASLHYSNVEVFCVNVPRNVLGNWSVRIVATVEKKQLDLSDYTIKDEAMAKEARYGFMIWDGESSGTLNNVLNLVAGGKQCLVFKKWTGDFATVNGVNDIKELIAHANLDRILKIDKKIHLYDRISDLRQHVLITNLNEPDGLYE